MTQPGTTAQQFTERMKYLASQDFGGETRPGLVAAMANGTASASDLNMISGFVKALDLQKVALANQGAGINMETSPENADLLTTIGEDGAIVQRANTTVQQSANKDAASAYLNGAFETIAQYSANSGDVIFPQPNSFAPGNKAPDGSSNENWFQKGWHGVLSGLQWIGRLPGFMYQEGVDFENNLFNHKEWASQTLGLDSAMKAAGYDPKSWMSNLDYSWSHGESDYRNLGPAVAAHGQAAVDTAIKMFQNDKGYGSAPTTSRGPAGLIPTGNIDFQGALANYQSTLNAQYRDGKITAQQYGDETKQLSNPDLQATYQAVDAAHVSFGRDLANEFVNYDKNPGLFRTISGAGDFLGSLGMDPSTSLIAGAKNVKFVKYGAQILPDEAKVSRIYGVPDKVSGIIPKLNPVTNYRAVRARANLSDWLKTNAAIRDAADTGDHATAAALRAQQAARHPDFEPAYMEAQGWRAAHGAEEIAKAHEAGTYLSLGGDVTHEAMNPVRGGSAPEERAASAEAAKKGLVPAIIGAKPLETPEEFTDWLVTQGGMYRWLSGLSIRQARYLPGVMSFAGEARAGIMGKLAYNRVVSGAPNNPLLQMIAKGTLPGVRAIDHDADASKLIPSDEGEAYKTGAEAEATGQEIGGRDAGMWRSFARSLGAKNDALVRRLTGWLPTNHVISLNSVQASADIERFLRSYLPKDQAAFGRYLWDQADSESARRQIGRALVNQVFDSAGLTRSPAGREYINKWNAAFDDLDNVRYGKADTDLVADMARGQRRVAMNLGQMETHLHLPAFTEIRRAAAKSAIAGFDKPLDQIGGRIVGRLKEAIAGDTPMKSWITSDERAVTAADGDTLDSIAKRYKVSADALKIANPTAGATLAAGDKIIVPGGQDIVAGIRRMLASPTATVRYGLFNNQSLARMFAVVKLGWLGTTSNAIRQYLEEYTGLVSGGELSTLGEGKRLWRAMGNATPVIAAMHHMIPHFLRPNIRGVDDAWKAGAHSRLDIVWGERPQDALDEKIKENLGRHVIQPEVLEVIGSRQTTQAEGGAMDAIEAHNAGVQMVPVTYKKTGEFKGYTEKDLRGDAGRKAHAAALTTMFVDKDEPSRRVLAYLMWNHAHENPGFLKKLDEDTLWRMESYVPVGYKKGAPISAATFQPPSTDAIKDYIRSSPDAGRFRQLAEWLKHDEAGYPIRADDQVGLDNAIERYTHSQIFNVHTHVFGQDGTMPAPLVSDLLRGRTPSELELSKLSETRLPPDVIQAEYLPAPETRLDKLGEKITQAASMGTKVFDAIVTNPLARMERKPLFMGSYARAYRELQPYYKMMVENGFQEADAEGIIDRMSVGRALQNTLKYLDNPHIASQMSAVAQNFYLFYRAQEDFLRRWIGIVKEHPETLRLAHQGIMAGIHSGMLYRDSDGNVTLAYPGSGAIIDAFLMAQRGLGIADDHGLKIPVAHDLTTKLDYLNPSLMNPAGFSATPMLSIPWDMLKLAIPGHDMLKSDVDMAFNGQLGNNRSWWQQFMPTEINRIIELQGDNNDTGSQVGGAAATTIMNASIAGQLNDAADPVIRQEKITDLKTQTLAAMWARALMAFALPGASSMPELDYKDSNGNFIGDPQADLSWRAMGVKNMSDEFKAMVQSFGFGKAIVVWADMHPKYLPYASGKTQLSAPGASADPTHPATQWIFDNKALFDGPYKKVAAYFIPPAPGSFDQIGWNALQEIGVRQNKSLEQYYLDIATKNAVTTWYAAKDKYDPMIAHLKATGQDASVVQKQYDDIKKSIHAEYPILTQWQNDHAIRASDRTYMVNNLRAMVKDPTVKLPELQGVAQMLEVLDLYNAKMASLKGQHSNWSSSERQSANAGFESNMNAIVQKFPGLNDVYNGVFREMEQ